MGFAPIRTHFPDATGTFDKMPREKNYIASLVQQITNELDSRSRDDVSRASILLQSPNGGVWAVFVDDAGVLRATKVRG